MSSSIKQEVNDLIRKTLRMYIGLYPPVDWQTFKAQVLSERLVFNPTRRWGLIWFHIPSVISTIRNIDYDSYKWITIHHPFFKEMRNKHVNFAKIKTISMKGMKEQELLEEAQQQRELL